MMKPKAKKGDQSTNVDEQLVEKQTLTEQVTRVMATDGLQVIVYLEGTQMEHEFKYLGSLVQVKKVASTVEILSRIG